MCKTKIEMRNISIEFPGVKALSDVDFEMESGTIHALIGANGAGKSTLMKILSGAYNHYTGKILINGNEVHIDSPRTAKELGIDIVYQEVDTALIPYLDVGENIMLDVLATKMKHKQFVNWKEIYRKARNALNLLNLHIDVKMKVADLDLAQKQMVLIARAIVEEKRFLILDEPTAPLSHRETEELFRVVRDLANNNVGIIFISHRLPELFEICETITIMKDGKNVITQPIEGLSKRDVIEYMLGRNFIEQHQKPDSKIGKIALEVVSLYEKGGLIKDVSFHVRKGEVIGIAGLVGAGKTELCKTIFGALPIESGKILIGTNPVKIKTTYAAVKHGLALVPEERRKEGVLVEEPVYSNLSASNLHNFTSKLGFLRPKAEKEAARKMIQDLGIKTPSESQKVALLSGGNQQKVAVGKWLMSNAEIYVFDEPTKGVDVGAKGDIFDLISGLAENGKGIIYASSEMTEILSITDRIYVMYDGRIVKELLTHETNEQEILYYSTGGK
ncbi:sugar ABC transporter ATP-binding protein [Neobacillus notoginsengisoli]|uniref:Sugar ABC transporter ATP-binding protein n=1 Tax=Neobacillus notoginsengisoli TaxID=1578198 RepID=A0A417YPU2_9BACI|nr:sugar ABC transporter ATP-binding protein [Neobacillus notoginsengisoli]RHW35736.1 sugar ABC transporter ATP-binding protein [Neobacillus notoginsengisoli]